MGLYGFNIQPALTLLSTLTSKHLYKQSIASRFSLGSHGQLVNIFFMEEGPEGPGSIHYLSAVELQFTSRIKIEKEITL
jgi:hypothetical protein